jgi:hypothetical protein
MKRCIEQWNELDILLIHSQDIDYSLKKECKTVLITNNERGAAKLY